MRNAIKPDFINNIAQQKAVETKGATIEEIQINSLSESAGWKTLERYIIEQIDGLDQINRDAMATGATFEEIGQNTVVSNLAKDVIRRILNKVSDARAAVERPDGK